MRLLFSAAKYRVLHVISRGAAALQYFTSTVSQKWLKDEIAQNARKTQAPCNARGSLLDLAQKVHFWTENCFMKTDFYVCGGTFRAIVLKNSRSFLVFAGKKA